VAFDAQTHVLSADTRAGSLARSLAFARHARPPSFTNTTHANWTPLGLADLAPLAIFDRCVQIVRCCQIMGRKEGEDLSAAQIFYPCMQCADVFFLKVSACFAEEGVVVAAGLCASPLRVSTASTP